MKKYYNVPFVELTPIVSTNICSSSSNSVGGSDQQQDAGNPFAAPKRGRYF